MKMLALRQTHVRISRLDRTLITAVVLLSSVFPVELFSNTPPAPNGLNGQYSGKQGQVLVVTGGLGWRVTRALRRGPEAPLTGPVIYEFRLAHR